MINALEPLVDLPGVELAMLATIDGVPIASCGRRSDAYAQQNPGNERSKGNDDAMAAMALSWLGELQSSTSPLSWGDTERVQLGCARGSLMMQRCRRAVLLIVLGPGVSAEDVRLPMAGVVARIERSNKSSAPTKTSGQPNPPGALPSQEEKAPITDSSETSKPNQEKA